MSVKTVYTCDRCKKERYKHISITILSVANPFDTEDKRTNYSCTSEPLAGHKISRTGHLCEKCFNDFKSFLRGF